MKSKTLSEYMVEMNLPVPFDNDFISLVPKQREVINKFMSEGVITGYAVSLEDAKLWTTILAESKDGVIDTLMEFPVINFVDYKISKLAFHFNLSLISPQFSQN